MIRSLLAITVATLALVACTALANEQEIFLPDDCDAVTINGKGFQLRFEEIKRDWQQVKDESEKVESPRPLPKDDAEGSESEEKVVANDDLYDAAKREGAEKDYGLVEDDLLKWIGDRATALMAKVERYNKEARLVEGGNRIVINIMLLNILVDLGNLNKEEIPTLKWVKNKLKKVLADNIHEQASSGEVMNYTRNLIDSNKAIELKLKGSNDPGKTWITNAQALRRILHEQRYSSDLSKIIIEYLAGPFNMMKRSAVYQIYRRSKTLDDGMFYAYSRNRVPRSFPFSAQDAIAHGEY